MNDEQEAAEPTSSPLFTIADVAKSCGLPQPAIAQLVSRTWTPRGWMYTADQIAEAIIVAEAIRHRVRP
ncbi:hypothetical protein BST46_23160 [Mycobacterium timonense]|uniref:HTH merR-type domain-containing protein n=2 Tax=Mycobacterium avium complex (MAC) TaxID=120793 RepID=A0ABX3TFS9_9MYCO|nr:hypothetical protein BST19_25815 [Mycobacterium bouchedurhonense]ORB77682.1 hypothetical protein BST46_23160 [Mycobacterium timonense]